MREVAAAERARAKGAAALDKVRQGKYVPMFLAAFRLPYAIDPSMGRRSADLLTFLTHAFSLLLFLVVR